MIQPATPDMLPELKKLWQVCFGDSAAGINFVFTGLLRPEDILVYTGSSGRAVAMLCFKLLPFTTQGKTFPGAYIFGVGTLPEYRGKGISAALLEKAEQLLREQGVRVACLIPASEGLFDFYAAHGFETQFYYKQLKAGRDEIPLPDKEGRLSPYNLEDLAKKRGRVFGGSLLGEWDEDYLRYTGAECRFLGGEVLRLTRANEYPNYAVCYPDGKGGILVKETTVPVYQLDSFLAALHERYNAQSYRLRLRADSLLADKWPAQTLPFAMTKWYYEEDARGGNPGGAPWFAFGLDDVN